MSGRWIDNQRKKKEEEARAAEAATQAEKTKPVSSGAAEFGKQAAAEFKQQRETQTKQNSWKAASETPEMDTAKLTKVYGVNYKYDSNGQATPDMSGMSSSGLQDAKLRVGTEIGGFGQSTKAANMLTDALEDEQAARQKNAQTRAGAMETLAGLNLMGFDGQAIDANTAEAATVVRGINSIADDDARAKAKKAYETLTKTPGSRFYGESTDGVGDFLESASLTKSEYRKAADEYALLFYGDGGHEQEDASAYLEARQEIEEGGYGDYAKNQLVAALDKAYNQISGKSEKPEKKQETQELESQNAQQQKDEKKPGFWAGLTEQMPQAQEAAQPEQPVQQESEAAEEQGAVQQGGNAPEVQGPVQQKAMTPEERIVSEGGMSFEEWMAAGQPGKEDTQKQEARTIGEAAESLLRGEYDSIEGEGKDELDRMLEGSGYARRMIGTLTEADSREIALNNSPAENIAYGSIASQGQTIKTLYDAMSSDSFPAELRGDVLAQMVAWASQAEKMEQQGTLGGDSELPLMERLLTTDERAMDELASIYAARDELLQDKADLRRAREEENAQALSDARGAAGHGAGERAGRTGRAEHGHGLRRPAGGGGRLFQAGRGQRRGEPV